MTSISILRAGPLTTLQDAGRFGMLKHGISSSGPMDRGAFEAAGALLGSPGSTGIEFTRAGFSFRAEDAFRAATFGGRSQLSVNGETRAWADGLQLWAGDVVDITPGAAGNYGYIRFEREIDVPVVLGSRSTNVAVGLGGFKGRALQPGDQLLLAGAGQATAMKTPTSSSGGPIRVLWGLHADLFDAVARQAFVSSAFAISQSLDRMGVRLVDATDIFLSQRRLTLVSDAIVPGDIQILGDGTPIVLMRDHQPIGGYPRIATIVSADLDRFAQLRPGAEVHFRPVTLEHAR